MKKFRKPILMLLLSLTLVMIIAFIGGVIVNSRIIKTGKTKIIAAEDAAALSDVDCILVLGCGVRDDGSPTAMLNDRLKVGVNLYKTGCSEKLLMSGDHGRVNYDEVNTMKQFAIADGVPSEDIFMDHAGFSTYESIYRAKEIFKVKKLIIVTQEYHLYRALHIAKAFGLEAWGVSADLRSYVGQDMREVREVLARNKDFLTSIFKPKPTFLGEAIPVSGNGDLTNDK